MKKLIFVVLALLGCAVLCAADEMNGVVVSNATTAVFDLRVMLDQVEWNGTDTVEVSGTVVNMGENEAQFVGLDLTLKNEAGSVLVDKSIAVTPDTVLSHAQGSFDAELDCTEKPSLLIYEVTGQ